MFSDHKPVHLQDRQPSPYPYCSLRPRGQAARWRPGSQGTQLPSQPISRLTTKQPMASPPRSSS